MVSELFLIALLSLTAPVSAGDVTASTSQAFSSDSIENNDYEKGSDAQGEAEAAGDSRTDDAASADMEAASVPSGSSDSVESEYTFPADPSHTQLLLSPTAYTLKEGQSRIGVTDLAFFQYNYGLTDHLQIGINTVFIVATSIDLKAKFVEVGDFAAAALLGFGFSPFSRDSYGGYARLVGTQKLGSVTASLGASYGGGLVEGDKLGYAAATVGADWRINHRVALVGEYNLSFDVVSGGSPINSLGWGARVIWPRFALTIGYLSPLVSETLKDGLIGIPYLDFSYGF